MFSLGTADDRIRHSVVAADRATGDAPLAQGLVITASADAPPGA